MWNSLVPAELLISNVTRPVSFADPRVKSKYPEVRSCGVTKGVREVCGGIELISVLSTQGDFRFQGVKEYQEFGATEFQSYGVKELQSYGTPKKDSALIWSQSWLVCLLQSSSNKCISRRMPKAKQKFHTLHATKNLFKNPIYFWLSHVLIFLSIVIRVDTYGKCIY